jgi:hypothetical protein
MGGFPSAGRLLLLLVPLILPAQDIPRRPATISSGVSSATQVISPVAVVTWVTRDGSNYTEIDLVVVWRGSPGWFRSSTQRGSSGGSAGKFQASVTYGDVRLDVALTTSPRVVTIQETPVPLDQKNVVLVDNVDSPSGPDVVKTLWVDPALADQHRIGPVLGRSPEIVAFLRCDVRLQEGIDVVLQKLCADVIGK